MSEEKDKLKAGGSSKDPEAADATTALNPTAEANSKAGVSKNAGAGAGPSKKAHKGSVQIQEPPVSETRGYTIVKIEEKHGPLHRAIPEMPLPLAIICCLLNCCLPGVGE